MRPGILEKIIGIASSQAALYLYAGLCYFITATIGIYWHLTSGYVSVWFPNTIILIFILRSQSKYALGYLIAGMTGNLLATYYMGRPFGAAIVLTLCNSIITLAALIYVHLQNRTQSKITNENTIRETIKLGIILITGCLISSVAGGVLAANFFDISYIKSITSWFSSNILPLLALLPLGLIITQAKIQTLLKLKNFSKFVIFTIFTIIITIESVNHSPYPFILILMPLLLSAFYFRFFEIALLSLINTLVFLLIQTNLLEKNVIHDPALLLIYGHVYMCLTLIPPLLVVLLLKQRAAFELKLQESEELWKFALENGGQGVWDWNPSTGKIYFSPTWKSLLGYNDDEIENSDEKWTSLVHPDDLSRVIKEENRHLSGETNEYICECRMQCKNGNYKWVLDHGKIIRESLNEKSLRMIGTLTDIDALKNAEQALFAEKERLHITLESIRDAVLVTDENGIITFINPAAEDLLEFSAKYAIGKHFHDLCMIVSEETGKELEDPISICLRENKVYYFKTDAVLVNKIGTHHYIQDATAPLRSPSGSIIGAVVVLQDQTVNRNLHKDLKYQAAHDALTGLINRREFESKLKKMIDHSPPVNHENCLLYLDLDKFKIINDTAGHAAGDELLRKISDILRNNIRQTDILARLGGDEFAIILPDCKLNEGTTVANNIITALKDFRLHWDGKIHTIGTSIGLVNFTSHRKPFETILSHADVACYTAKLNGGYSCSAYNESTSEAAQNHSELQIASSIRDALVTNRFRLFIHETKPLTDSCNLKPFFEVLIRLIDKNGNIIMPSVFISTAERNNLMVSIDKWVLKTLLTEYGDNIAKTPDLAFSINLSSNSIISPDFADFLSDVLNSTTIPKSNIGFELSEEAVINHAERALRILNIIQNHGCFVSLDNFGIGLSSFNHIKNYQIKYVKIDGSLIKMIDKSDIDLAIVESINQLSHRLGTRTIACQVETREILEISRTIGIDLAQGYYFGKARSLEEFLESLQEKSH